MVFRSHWIYKIFTLVGMKVVQFRVARPTNNLAEIVKFYHEGLGLEILGRFEDHSGYDGVMLGLPDKIHHLELPSIKTKLLCLNLQRTICWYFIMIARKFIRKPMNGFKKWERRQLHPKTRIG